jgi:hypothetical protein
MGSKTYQVSNYTPSDRINYWGIWNMKFGLNGETITFVPFTLLNVFIN